MSIRIEGGQRTEGSDGERLEDVRDDTADPEFRSFQNAVEKMISWRNAFSHDPYHSDGHLIESGEKEDETRRRVSERGRAVAENEERARRDAETRGSS